MGTPYRVLLVEDDRDLAIAVQMALSAGPFDVRTSSSLGEAMEALRVLPPPDAIVTELSLFHGPPPAHLLEELARDPALAGVPVVVISAWDKATEVAAAHGIPADRVLAKPLDLRRLEATLESCVRASTPRARRTVRVAVTGGQHRTGAFY